ncbi:hypothetical protein FB45DRAFT_70814 [Roridomyces roridus]|uniref:Uncharacterized protein n=1 Tax=Roridomyces roridus TaxID=1738132 RepID=A0AAD7FIC9_9AGAR|nr:hypothetical protein FB45DRAFT_70814 [Roridomyces roridus]
MEWPQRPRRAQRLLPCFALLSRTGPTIDSSSARSVTIRQDAVPRLAEGLSSSSRLATYIRALHIIDVSFTREDIRASLGMLFPLLTHLSHLDLSFPYINMCWSTCPPVFCSAVINLLSSPTLKCVALRNCWGGTVLPCPPRAAFVRGSLAHECGHNRRRRGGGLFVHGNNRHLTPSPPLHPLHADVRHGRPCACSCLDFPTRRLRSAAV